MMIIKGCTLKTSAPFQHNFYIIKMCLSDCLFAHLLTKWMEYSILSVTKRSELTCLNKLPPYSKKERKKQTNWQTNTIETEILVKLTVNKKIEAGFQTYRQNVDSNLPKWHMTLTQCRINVSVTKWRCIDVDTAWIDAVIPLRSWVFPHHVNKFV